MPSPKVKALYARARHAEKFAGKPPPKLDINGFAVAPTSMTPRRKRQEYANAQVGFDCQFRAHVDGSAFANATIRRLWQNVDSIVHLPKATGSFLSHLRIWEEVSRSNQPGGLVVEDDCMPIYHPFFAIEPLIDSDVGLVFLNDRIATNQPLGNYESFVQQSSRSLFAARPMKWTPDLGPFVKV